MFNFCCDATHFVDISATIGTKVRAYSAHESQMVSPVMADEEMRALGEAVAGNVGNATGAQYVEAFLAF